MTNPCEAHKNFRGTVCPVCLEAELTALRAENERLKIDNGALRTALANQMQCVNELKELYHSIRQENDRLKADKRELVGALERTTQVDKYRSKPDVSMDYDMARIILTLKFPKDLHLYRLFRAAVVKHNEEG
jgi:regulator of replication initiation timing